jgi:methylenetetrahydrofolate dehydrogenase (NADP+)/methenyltetrahydrofolate cyclohydrolase
MNILDGKLVSTQLLNDIKEKIEGHIEISQSRLGYQISKPSMAIVLVGNNPASESYDKHIKDWKEIIIKYNSIKCKN